MLISLPWAKVLGSCLFLLPLTSYSMEEFLLEWRAKYPFSNSDDIECQLCHRDEDGGEPWNSYGWDIRQEYRTNGNDIGLAIDTARFADQDDDPIGAESIEEIIHSFQPGWTVGNNNTLFMANGDPINSQPPPDLPMSTALDFPTETIDPIPGTLAVSDLPLTLVQIATGFNRALRAVKAPGIEGSLFVVQQPGQIMRVDLASGEKSLFLDISDRLTPPIQNGNNLNYGERGLLGLAFHPDFTTNGLFYTYQSEPRRPEQDSLVDFTTLTPTQNPNHRSVIVEYRVSDPSCNATIQKLRDVLIFDQPQGNHNGGDLLFGTDDYLYISVGDGGGGGDLGTGHGLYGNGRDNSTILGTILRIDPQGNNSASGNYGIPFDNPFVGGGDEGVDEIFAYGLRNPFRMSFDALTDDLYAADVGQLTLEEVDLISSGGNYGWNWKEGSFFFYNPAANPNYVSDVAPPGVPNDLVDPIGEYDHQVGISVIGGYVYRGTTIAGAEGQYLFADLNGTLFELNTGTGELKTISVSNGNPGFITGFGQDGDNELYLVTGGEGGRLLKLVETGDTPSSPSAEGEQAQCPASEELCVPIVSSNGNIAQVCL